MFGGSGKSKAFSGAMPVRPNLGAFTWTSGFAAASERPYPRVQPRFQGFEVERQARAFFFPAASAAPSLGNLCLVLCGTGAAKSVTVVTSQCDRRHV